MNHTFEQLRDEFRKLQEQMHRFWVAMEQISGGAEGGIKERRRPGRPAAPKAISEVSNGSSETITAPRRRGRPAKPKPVKVSTGRGGPGKKRGPRTAENWQTRIENMLRETGRPLTANELAELLAPRMEKRVLEIKNVINSTTAMMRREGKLDFIPHVPGKKRGKYALANAGNTITAGDNHSTASAEMAANERTTAGSGDEIATAQAAVQPAIASVAETPAADITVTSQQPEPLPTSNGNESH